MRFLPIFLNLNTRSVVLVGAGYALGNKLRLARAAGAKVVWFAPPQERVDDADILYIERAPNEFDLGQAEAVIASAGDPLDGRVSKWARERRIPVNVVDRPDLSTFIMPAIIDRGDVVVAVGTSGHAPVLARRIREKIESLLPDRIGEFAALLGGFRSRVSARFKEFSDKRKFWEQAVDGPVAAAALAGKTSEANALLNELLARPDLESKGSVSIVGAGPGDPDLLTLKALRAISDADIIFYDDLVTQGILDRVRRDAERIFVGKRKGRPGIGQNEIHRLLIKAALSGKRVVRLKGGDPFVFGRGGEEIEVLRQAGISVSVVPGVTAALGAAAEAELPLTLRNVATKLAIVTANRAEEGEVNWSNLSDPLTTVVVYMGLSSAAAVRDGLIAAGRAPSTPAAILSRGTWEDSRSAVGRLDALPALAVQAKHGPALIVIGDAVKHSAPWRAALLAKEVA